MKLYTANFIAPSTADALFNLCERLEFVKRPNPRNPKQFLKRGTITFQDGNIAAGAADVNQFHNVIVDLASAPPEVVSLRDALTKFAGRKVNYLSLNRYPDGSSGIGYHNHKEDLEIDTPVLLVSVGAARTMWLRKIGQDDTAKPTLLQHGSLFVMPAKLNATHQHGVLPEKNVTMVRYSFNCKCLPTN
jgi:hypothetical protein